MTGENLLYQCGAGAGHPDNEDRFGTAQTQVLASGEKLGRENCLGLAYDSVHGAVGRELAPDIVRLLILTEGKLRSTQVAQRLSKCKMKLDPMAIVAADTQGAPQQEKGRARRRGRGDTEVKETG